MKINEKKYIKIVFEGGIRADVTKECPVSYKFTQSSETSDDLRNAVERYIGVIHDTLDIRIPENVADRISNGGMICVNRNREIILKHYYDADACFEGYAFLSVERNETGFSVYCDISKSGLIGWNGAIVYSESVLPYENEQVIAVNLDDGNCEAELKNAVDISALKAIASKAGIPGISDAMKSMIRASDKTGRGGAISMELDYGEKFHFASHQNWVGAAVTNGSFSTAYIARSITRKS